MTTATRDLLADAVNALASVCDGAREQDGMGFNGVDSGYGKQMAQVPAQFWTAAQRSVLYQMLSKYRGQLAGFGIDFTKIPKPDILDEFSYIPKAKLQPILNECSTEHGQPCAKPLCAKAKRLTASARQQAEATGKPTAKRIVLQNNRFEILFPYDEKTKNSVKTKLGARWDKDKKVWWLKLGLIAAAQIQEFAQLEKFDIDEAAAQHIGKLATEALERLDASRAEDAELHLEGFGNESYKPFPFQRGGIVYAINAERTFIADEMGLGKTIQGLGTIYATNSFPALIVCPASLKRNWEREAKRAMPGKSVFVIEKRDSGTGAHTCKHGGKQLDLFAQLEADTGCEACRFAAADVYIINYDIVPGGWTNRAKKQVDYSPAVALLLNLRPLKILVLDESHYCKNGDAQRTRALINIAKNHSIPRRLLLTGTPLLNRPKELAAQLDILGRLEDFGGWWKFMQRYCGASQKNIGGGSLVWDFDGASNLEELNQRLRSTCYVRREKKQVLKELPDKLRTVIPVEITNRKDYDKAEKQLIAWIRDKALADEKFRQSIAHLDEEEQERRLKEHANDKAEKARRAETLVKLNELKQVASRGKKEGVQLWISEFREANPGKKLVIFAYYRETQRELMTLFPGAAHVFGDDSGDERQKQVDRFQNDPGCTEIIVSLQAGGVGITLTAADTVLFWERGWTPALHDQAEDRCHRIGQKNCVSAIYFDGENTIDEDIAELIDAKRATVSAAAQGGGTEDGSGFVRELTARLVAKAG